MRRGAAAACLCLSLIAAACGRAASPGVAAPSPSPTNTPAATVTASPSPLPTPKPSPLVSAKGAIVVNEPRSGDEIMTPLIIAGEASVFEANVVFRIVTAGGKVLADGHTTATVGAPLKGTFKAEVPYDVPLYGESGFVEVFERSPKDGSITEIVRVPVNITGSY